MNDIGSFIKQIRTEKGISQKELAHKINVTVQAVSKWETGKGIPDISLIEPLSRELGITPTELFRGSKIAKKNLLDEANSLVVNTVKDKNKKVKINRIITIFVVLITMISIEFFNLYSIHNNKLGDIILLSYEDSNFKLSNLYLSVSNDFKNQNFSGGKLEISDNIIENIDNLKVFFCYNSSNCYKLIDSNGKNGLLLNNYMFYNSFDTIKDAYDENGKAFNNSRDLESKLLNAYIKVETRKAKKISEYKFNISLDYLFHEHTKIFQ